MERSEQIGLGVAAAGHVLLFGLLSLSLVAPPDDDFRNPPLEVMITDEVGLEAAAPNPSMITPATSVAPELGLPEDFLAAPAEPSPSTEAPDPVRPPVPTASERPVTKPTKPEPRNRDPSSRRRPDKPNSAVPSTKPKGARLGDDFLKGVTDSPSASTTQSPNAPITGAAMRSIEQELYRKLKPHWRPPSGADVEMLRTKVVAKLDEYGNVERIVSVTTSGETPSNRSQVALHQERAVAAVKLAAPYSAFPQQYYSAWQEIRPTLFLGL